jgi:epsilon-lactone hydrolase
VSSLLLSAKPEHAATLLYLHGGAYVLGSAFGYRHLAGALAVAADTAVLVPDYRLAPEHRFPAAVDDALRAYEWMLERGTPPQCLALAGDSTGGGLALSLLLSLKDRGMPLPGSAALLCPSVDLSWTVHDSRADPSDVAAAAEELRRRFTAPYLGGHPIDDPIVSPLTADRRGLPPMLIQAATGDAQLAHAHRLAEHARSCDVDARLELYPTATHVFQLFWSFLPEAAEAIQRADRFSAEAPHPQPGDRWAREARSRRRAGPSRGHASQESGVERQAFAEEPLGNIASTGRITTAQEVARSIASASWAWRR